jgi:O-antigen/teichoic acid export membrane protein
MARVRRGTAANIIRQLINVVGQLALVPILLKFWGAELFGEWQMLTAGAAYVALLNFGFQTYATNRMNQHYSRNEMREFNRILQSSLFLALVIAFVGTLLALIVSFLLPIGNWLAPATSNNRTIIALLLTWHAGSLITGVLGGIYRAVGEYSRDMFFANLYYSSQMIVTALIAATGGRLLAASAAQLVLLAVLASMIRADLIRRHPEVELGIRQRDRRLALSFVAPSALFLVIQVSMLLSIQGSTLVVGAVMGAGAVAVFVATRSLVNLIPQAINSIGQVMWPEFTALEANGKLDILRDMQQLLTKLSLWLAVCAALLLHFVGADVVSVWTHNRLPYDGLLMDALLLFQLTASWYLPSSLVIASSNRHKPLALCQAAVVAGLGLGFVFARNWGAAGVVFGLLLADALTSAWYVPRAACRLLRCNLTSLFGQTILRGVPVAACLFVIARMLSGALVGSPALTRISVLAIMIGTVGLILLVTIWLSSSEKARLRPLFLNAKLFTQFASEQ